MSYKTKDKYNLLYKTLNLDSYGDGNGITIASVESLKNTHGKEVYYTIKTYAPGANVISYTDEFGESGIGDDGKVCNFPKFVDWCIKNKVDIVTSSVCWQADKQEEKDAINTLYENGIIFVNAAGNKCNEDVLGEGYDASNIDIGVISVSSLAIDMNGKETWAGNDYGSAIDVVTYGQDLPYLEDDIWLSWSGTSAATPLMASMFALLKECDNRINSKNAMPIIKSLCTTCIYKDKEYEKMILPPRPILKTYMDTWYAVNVEKIDEPSVWAKESWIKAWKVGAFDGTNPKNNITREQMACVLDRLGLLED